MDAARELAAGGLRGASLRPRLACRAALLDLTRPVTCSSTAGLQACSSRPHRVQTMQRDGAAGEAAKTQLPPGGTALESAFFGRGRIASRVKSFFCPVWHGFTREAVPNAPYMHGVFGTAVAVAVAVAASVVAMLVKQITW
jgi:hypothetical protein